VVALNALNFVREQVGEEGSTGPTPGRASQRSSGVEASYRAGLVRIGMQSRVAWRYHTYVGQARRICVGGALVQFFKGFQGVDFSGVCSF
jgi:hypothetical protein